MRIIVAGALGEVGRTVGAALGELGHSVVGVSSRAPLDESPEIASLVASVDLIRSGEIDLVVNCSGRGDRRLGERTGQEATDALAAAVAAAGIPGVLLSTTRVLEGYDVDYDEDAPPRALTPYAQANAANEDAWLGSAGSRAHVVRITNYFAPPGQFSSPQSLLLPWSLVTEALASGEIGIRSGPSLAKGFVSAGDVARAVLVVAASSDAPAVCATVPGSSFTLQALADVVGSAVVAAGRARPSVTFGPDGPVGAACRPGWLAGRGWSGALTPDAIEQVITGWVLRWSTAAPAADDHEGR